MSTLNPCTESLARAFEGRLTRLPDPDGRR